jgi:signal transduction histidine kinase
MVRSLTRAKWSRYRLAASPAVARHERLIPGATRGFRDESVAHMSRAPGEGITGLVALTNQPIAVEDAHEYEEAQDTATRHERQRLARELHDAVTQTLFAAGLNAQALPLLWQTNRIEGERCLAELQRLTWGALAEMRTLLLELRPAALTQIDLLELLRQLAAAAVARGPELEVSVKATGKRRLAADVQLAFYRVAREALNNIVKHANARHVLVRLHRNSRRVELHVIDDGDGFARESIPAGHFGVNMMRERVEAIGATLDLDSRPGYGSALRLLLRDPSLRRGKQA